MDQNNNNQNPLEINPSDSSLQDSLQNSFSQAEFPNNSAGSAQNGWDPSFQEYQAPVYATSFKPIKKKINPLAFIIPAAILIIAAAVVFLVLFLNKTNYKKAEQNYFNNLLSSALSEAEEKENNLQAQYFHLNFQSPLSNIQGNVMDISNIDFNIESALKGDSIFSSAAFKMGDIDINGELWFDNAKKSMLLYLPGISDIYVRMNANQSEEITAEKNSEYIRILNDVLSKTFDSYFEIIGDTDVEENQEFKADGTTYTADTVTIRLDAAKITKLVKALYDNLLDNEEAVKLLCNSLDLSGKAELIEFLEKSGVDFDSLEKAIGSRSVDMTVYIKNNEIIGRYIVVNDGDNTYGLKFYDIPLESGSVKYISYVQSKQALITIVNEDSAEKDVHSGSIVLKVMGQEVATLTYSDFAVTEELFQGTASLTVKNQPAFAANLSLKTEGDEKSAVITVPNIFTLTLTTGPSDLSYKDEPQVSDNQIAVIEQEMTENENFIKFINDFSKYINQFTGYGDLYDEDFHYFEY